MKASCWKGHLNHSLWERFTFPGNSGHGLRLIRYFQVIHMLFQDHKVSTIRTNIYSYTPRIFFSPLIKESNDLSEHLSTSIISCYRCAVFYAQYFSNLLFPKEELLYTYFITLLSKKVIKRCNALGAVVAIVAALQLQLLQDYKTLLNAHCIRQ